jgi:CDP-glucose 4,6-dehydratase
MQPGDRFDGVSVMVTGGQGFIGSWLAERLVNLGARVVVPCRDIHPAARFHSDRIAEHCQIEHADVCDYAALLRILSEHEVSAVFHLAAQPIVGIANRSPLATYESNVTGTYTLLEACRAHAVIGQPIERIVIASTDHAYGPAADVPYREDSAIKPTYPYDVSKGCTDIIARCYASTYDMPVAVTRLANVYGGGDRHWSRIVPDAARALSRGERPVIRSDGTPERDYLYVEDAVSAYLAVANSLDSAELRGRAWNASPGVAVSVLDVVVRLIAASGKELEPEIRGKGTPHAEADRLHIDSTAIREQLGWSPRWSMDEGLAETYRWYERHLSEQDMALGGQPA